MGHNIPNRLRNALETKSYGEIARQYGVSKGVVWRIVNDNYEPLDNAIRLALGYDLKITVLSQDGIFEGVYLPANAVVVECPTCHRQFIRITNRQIYCDPDCRKGCDDR